MVRHKFKFMAYSLKARMIKKLVIAIHFFMCSSYLNTSFTNFHPTSTLEAYSSKDVFSLPSIVMMIMFPVVLSFLVLRRTTHKEQNWLSNNMQNEKIEMIGKVPDSTVWHFARTIKEETQACLVFGFTQWGN